MMTTWLSADDLDLTRIDSEFYAPTYVEHEHAIRMYAAEHPQGIARLGNLARLKTGPFGSKLPSSLYRESGVPLFRVENVVEWFPCDNRMVYLDPAANEALSASEVKAHDLLMAKAGRVGDTCIVTSDYGPVANITEHVIALVPGNRADRYYLLAALNAPFVKKQAQRHGLGTLINYLGVTVTRSFAIPTPRPEVERSIGNKVRKAERLRELAAKAVQSVNKALTSELGVPSDVELYPNGTEWVTSFHETLRLNPQFYLSEYSDYLRSISVSLVPLRHYAKRARPVDLRTAVNTHCIRYYELGQMSRLRPLMLPELINTSEAPSRAKMPLCENSLIISLVKESIETTALVKRLPPDESWICTNGCAVLNACKPEEVPASYLYGICRSFWFIAQKCRYLTGTNIQSVDAKDLDEMVIPLPSDRDVVARIGGLVDECLLAQMDAADLLLSARSDVESLVDGTLDESSLHEESETIEKWLRANPSPFGKCDVEAALEHMK